MRHHRVGPEKGRFYLWAAEGSQALQVALTRTRSSTSNLGPSLPATFPRGHKIVRSCAEARARGFRCPKSVSCCVARDYAALPTVRRHAAEEVLALGHPVCQLVFRHGVHEASSATFVRPLPPNSMADQVRGAPRAVVLLSGGLDSSTVLAIAQSEGYDVHAVSFRYGQRHAVEVAAAQRVATARGVADHTIVDIDLRPFGGSALTADIPVPKDRDAAEMTVSIPVTYVPARNTIFLSFALALAEVSQADEIFLGVSAVDYSGYPDCRPEYVQAFEQMANLAIAGAVEGRQRIRIRAPLQHLSKAETIRLGVSLGVDYGVTTSCYDPSPEGFACGHCDSCHLRRRGFEEAGVYDPTTYAQTVQI